MTRPTNSLINHARSVLNGLFTLPQKEARMFNFTTVLSLAVAGVALAAFTAPASSATITGSFAAATSTNTPSLTDTGPLDWRMWHEDADHWTVTSPTLKDEKLGGTAISDLTVTFIDDDGVGTSNKLGARFSSHKFAWTNGTNTASDSGESAGLAIRGRNDTELPNDSFTFTVTAASADPHVITIYGALSRTFARLTLGAPGATTLVSIQQNSGTVEDWIYTASYTPNTAGDTLTVTLDWGQGWNFANKSSSLSGFNLSAVAVSIVPEPASLSLLGLGALALLPRRRA